MTPARLLRGQLPLGPKRRSGPATGVAAGTMPLSRSCSMRSRRISRCTCSWISPTPVGVPLRNALPPAEPGLTWDVVAYFQLSSGRRLIEGRAAALEFGNVLVEAAGAGNDWRGWAAAMRCHACSRSAPSSWCGVTGMASRPGHREVAPGSWSRTGFGPVNVHVDPLIIVRGVRPPALGRPGDAVGHRDQLLPGVDYVSATKGGGSGSGCGSSQRSPRSADSVSGAGGSSI